MRKRQKYAQPKFKTRIPTLIIMCVALFAILAFGQYLSWNIAGFFAPNVPVSDAPVAVPDGPNLDALNAPQNPVPTRAGSVVSQAQKSAAQKLLPLITPTKP